MSAELKFTCSSSVTIFHTAPCLNINNYSIVTYFIEVYRVPVIPKAILLNIISSPNITIIYITED